MKGDCSFYTHKKGKIGKRIKNPQPTEYPC